MSHLIWVKDRETTGHSGKVIICKKKSNNNSCSIFTSNLVVKGKLKSTKLNYVNIHLHQSSFVTSVIVRQFVLDLMFLTF